MKTGLESSIIGVVGPCGSGKSTLVSALKKLGIDARHIAQEHSYVATMWKRITNPDILVYLEASFETATRRRQLNWTEAEFNIQLERLANSRQHADVVIKTDLLKPDEIVRVVLDYINNHAS